MIDDLDQVAVRIVDVHVVLARVLTASLVWIGAADVAPGAGGRRVISDLKVDGNRLFVFAGKGKRTRVIALDEKGPEPAFSHGNLAGGEYFCRVSALVGSVEGKYADSRSVRLVQDLVAPELKVEFPPETLMLSEMGRGLFLGALALALLLGGALALPLARRFGQGRSLLVAAVVSGVALSLLGLQESLLGALLCLGANGMGAGLAVSLIVALLQHESEPALRGRLLSLYTVTSQVIPAAGGLGAGLLLELLPASTGLLFCGLGLTLLFILAVLRLRALRRYG